MARFVVDGLNVISGERKGSGLGRHGGRQGVASPERPRVVAESAVEEAYERGEAPTAPERSRYVPVNPPEKVVVAGEPKMAAPVEPLKASAATVEVAHEFTPLVEVAR